MFENLKVTLPDANSDTLDVSTLTDEQKIEIALVWRTKGVAVTSIAKIFKVTRRTIYQWLNKAKEHFMSNIEEMTFLELITDHDMQLEHLENVALAELDRITEPEYGINSEGEVHKRTRKSVKEISDLMKTVLAIRQQRMQLHLQVGLIPKTPERILHKISGADVELHEDYEKSSDELKLDLVTKLNRISRL